MAPLASGDDLFLLLSKHLRAGNMPHDFCMHTCTQKRACTNTHTTVLSLAHSLKRGSGITYLSTARDPRGHSHLGLVQVRWLEKKVQLPLPHRCVCLGLSQALAPHEAHSRHSCRGEPAHPF